MKFRMSLQVVQSSKLATVRIARFDTHCSLVGGEYNHVSFSQKNLETKTIDVAAQKYTGRKSSEGILKMIYKSIFFIIYKIIRNFNFTRDINNYLILD